MSCIKIAEEPLSACKSVRGFPNPAYAIKSRFTVLNFACCGAETMVDENNPLTPEQMAARIAELEGRLAKGSALSFKVSEKGAVSVYGLGRFPVTLYFEQWNKLLAHIDDLRAFMEANKSKLTLKEQSPR
jgi:hypothetical protein